MSRPIPIEFFELPNGTLISELTTKRFRLHEGILQEEVLLEDDWTPGRKWKEDEVKILIPQLGPPSNNPNDYKEVCPCCGSTKVSSWEKTYEDGTFAGGKDCPDCRALSPRWQDPGAGDAFWLTGPGLHKGLTIKETQEILKTVFPDGLAAARKKLLEPA